MKGFHAHSVKQNHNTMKNLIAYRTPNVWTNVLSFFISLTFMIVWLPFIRSLFDGSSYIWGTEYFGLRISGAGVTPSFIFLILQMSLYAALIVGLYRMRNRKLYFGLLGIWWANVFGNLLFDILKNGDTMFHGDTLNVHFSLTYIILPIAAFALFLIIRVMKSEKVGAEIPWGKENKILMYLFLGMLPVLFLLLSSGETSGTSDQIGVILAIAQCFYIPLIFKPFNFNKELKTSNAY